jgi:hypothetical protein
MTQINRFRWLVVALSAFLVFPAHAAQFRDGSTARELQRSVDELLGRGPVQAETFRYSGLIQCILTDLKVEKKDTWYGATAPGFSIGPGETVDITVRRQFGKGKETIYAIWDTDDDELKLCKGSGGGRCNSARIDGRRFASGIRMQFYLPGDASGVAECRYAR